jgi:predicted ribosome quality control (RQC) complex YloA/Tae2 family protein
MVRITLDLKKSIEENAGDYFERAKKTRKKAEGAKKAVIDQKIKLEALKKESVKEEEKTKKAQRHNKQWYEKFRWFISSEGFLCIGGRDATTNEIVIKKYAEKNDIIFHTDMAGSPFVVLKIKDKTTPPTQISFQEAADFTAVHSKGWKLGMSTLDVFYVTPEQVTKEANSGEFLTKGAFMIRGKTSYLTPTMNYAVGAYDGIVMGGPFDAVKKHCKEYVEISQGNEKTSDVAKIIQKKLGGDLDEIISVLPPGCKIKKV